MKVFAVILLTLTVFATRAGEIIPFPNRYEVKPGRLQVPGIITVATPDNEFAGLVPVISDAARRFYSIDVKESKNQSFIRLIRNEQISDPEGYRLEIGKEEIVLEAGTPQGCFYGFQSLLQLLNSGKSIACALIEDQPRYPWRGLMLDESRHFFGTDEVKEILDLMALHKLNKFHWHLTDVPGWRIEIKKYPLLTTVGGTGNHTDASAPARYYTQAQITEIVNYARDRFIEVIPEIDMPGHATAAVKAYPEFSGGGSERYPEFTFNPGKEGTYTFLTHILKEVGELFPSEYIHIGGDEVHFGNEQWSNLPEVKNLMETHSLKNLVEVEHYFLNRMNDSIQAIGKTAMGWDEVITAGLPASNTMVMWWRHDKPQLLREALQKNYEVILSPRIPLYFDFVQDTSHGHGRKWAGSFAPVESVYDFPSESFTGGISVSDPLIKGIQANVWTEAIHSPERLQFMLYPRISALSEAAWTEDSSKDFHGFTRRMDAMFRMYHQKGIRFFDFRNPEKTPEVPGPADK
jgi:hexosaminidase